MQLSQGWGFFPLPSPCTHGPSLSKKNLVGSGVWASFSKSSHTYDWSLYAALSGKRWIWCRALTPGYKHSQEFSGNATWPGSHEPAVNLSCPSLLLFLPHTQLGGLSSRSQHRWEMGLLVARPCAEGVCGIQPEHRGYQFSPMVVLVKMAQDRNKGEVRVLNLFPLHPDGTGVSGQVEMTHHEWRLLWALLWGWKSSSKGSWRCQLSPKWSQSSVAPVSGRVWVSRLTPGEVSSETTIKQGMGGVQTGWQVLSVLIPMDNLYFWSKCIIPVI